MGCGQTKEKQDDVNFMNVPIEQEVFKFLQLINDKFYLDKYQCQQDNNLNNFLTVMNSRYGGCVAND